MLSSIILNNDNTNSIEIQVLVCNREKFSIAEYQIEVNPHHLNINRLRNLIIETYSQRSFRMFNFYGIEILEECDLGIFRDETETNKLIFLTEPNETFDNSFLLKIFNIKLKIGEGSFGKVYLAEQKFTKEAYAFKKLNLYFNSIKDLNYLYKEIDVLKAIDHRNIIKLFNYSICDNKLLFILEYAHGGTLRKYLKEKKKLNEIEAKKLFTQIVKGVMVCHKKGIIHRDLKLENIVFKDNARTWIKIIDFGVAGLVKENKDQAGSLPYMPPEVIANASMELSPTIDIWSLGCILYELLTGERLFQANTKAEIKDDIKNNRLNSFPESLSDSVKDLIYAMIKTNPKERIKIQDIMYSSWFSEENAFLNNFNNPGANLTPIRVTNPSIGSNLSKESLMAVEKRASIVKYNIDCDAKQETTQPNSNTSKINLNTNNTNTNTHNQLSNLSTLASSNSSAAIKHFNTYKRLNTGDMKVKKEKSVATKLKSNTSDNDVIDLNFKMLNNYGGNFPNFMLPIGHEKGQKQRVLKITSRLKEYYEEVKQKKKEEQENELRSKSKCNTNQLTVVRAIKKTALTTKEIAKVGIKPLVSQTKLDVKKKDVLINNYANPERTERERKSQNSLKDPSSYASDIFQLSKKPPFKSTNILKDYNKASSNLRSSHQLKTKQVSQSKSVTKIDCSLTNNSKNVNKAHIPTSGNVATEYNYEEE